MKNLFFLSLLILASCTEGEQTLPGSTGADSEILFIVNDVLWEVGVKETASETFGAPIEGLNANEASFRVVQVNNSEFKSILKTHKNIVLISEGSTQGSQQDKWASGQLVVQLNWEHKEKLRQEFLRLKSIFEKKELNNIKKSLSLASKKIAEQSINKNFDIDVVIPSEYTTIKDTTTLFWATFNPQKQEDIKQLLIFSFIPKSTSLQQEVLQQTDSVFNKYLLGGKDNQFVQIETDYPPYYSNDTYRGLWKLKNGFMGGPFLIKTYFIENKVVVAAGLVFAPQTRKRNYVKRLEAIL